MKSGRLGNSQLVVSELGLGCMGLNSVYGEMSDRAGMINLVRQAVDLGITLFDTAQVYGPRRNEELFGEALEPVRDLMEIATKFGWDLNPDGGPAPMSFGTPFSDGRDRHGYDVRGRRLSRVLAAISERRVKG